MLHKQGCDLRLYRAPKAPTHVPPFRVRVPSEHDPLVAQGGGQAPDAVFVLAPPASSPVVALPIPGSAMTLPTGPPTGLLDLRGGLAFVLPPEERVSLAGGAPPTTTANTRSPRRVTPGAPRVAGIAHTFAYTAPASAVLSLRPRALACPSQSKRTAGDHSAHPLKRAPAFTRSPRCLLSCPPLGGGFDPRTLGGKGGGSLLCRTAGRSPNKPFRKRQNKPPGIWTKLSRSPIFALVALLTNE